MGCCSFVIIKQINSKILEYDYENSIISSEISVKFK